MYYYRRRTTTPRESLILVIVTLIIFVPNFLLVASGTILAVLFYKIFKALK